MGWNVHTVENKKGNLLVAIKEIFLEVNAENTKYMFMSLAQNAGRYLYVQIDDNFFESVEAFKYLRNIWTNQNSLQEEIKSKWIMECLLSLGAESFVFQNFIKN